MEPELGAWYREHATVVWRYARARVPTDSDAEDVTSEVFARATRSAERFDRERGTARVWLLGIARHATADWWRRRRPEDPSAVPPDVDSTDDPSDPLLRAEGADEVRRVLAVLSDREREAVALRFGAELSSAEVGEQLGVSSTAARMLVHRAVTKLRGVLIDE